MFVFDEYSFVNKLDYQNRVLFVVLAAFNIAPRASTVTIAAPVVSQMKKSISEQDLVNVVPRTQKSRFGFVKKPGELAGKLRSNVRRSIILFFPQLYVKILNMFHQQNRQHRHESVALGKR